MRPTSLSSRKHVKVGWLLRSHPQYTNFRVAIRDLQRRIGEEFEIELSLHTISHSTSKNTMITTRALKVVTNDEDCGRVLDGLIDALTIAIVQRVKLLDGTIIIYFCLRRKNKFDFYVHGSIVIN